MNKLMYPYRKLEFPTRTKQKVIVGLKPNLNNKPVVTLSQYEHSPGDYPSQDNAAGQQHQTYLCNSSNLRLKPQLERYICLRGDSKPWKVDERSIASKAVSEAYVYSPAISTGNIHRRSNGIQTATSSRAFDTTLFNPKVGEELESAR